MSQRGGQRGGGGGRGRGRGRRDQQPPPVASSSGRAGGRGRGSGPAPARQQPAATHSPSPSTSRYPPSPAQQLSQEVEQRLTLQPVPQPVQPAPVQPPPAQVPSSSSALAPAEHVQISTPPPSSSKSDRPPARPGYGTIGRKCIVRANHFLVDLSNKDLHHYDVTIKPEVTSKKVCREIINELVNSYWESHLGKRTPAYDGSKSLYTAGPFPFSSMDFVVRLPDRDGEARREREFRVAIKFAAKVDLYHLQQFLQGRQLDAPQETVQALDVVLGSMPSNRYSVVGRSFFSPQLGPMGSLGDGVQYWSGFYKSLRPAQMGLSLNIDVSARSFYEPIMVSDFVAQYLNVRQLMRPLSDQDRIKVKKALKGVTVQTTYGENARRYKIKGLSVQPTSQVMFPTSDNEDARISVLQYFRERYSITLNLPFLPALQAGNDARPAHLPMELCKIVEGQRYTKKLNERQVTALLRATCQRPPDRERSIKQMGGYVGYRGNNELLNEFGLQVRDALTSVDARVLPPPVLLYQGSQETPRVGAWNMIDKKMVNGGRVEFWTCVNFSRLRQADVHRFCEDLVNMCRGKGMDFNMEPLIPIRSSPPAQIEKALNDIRTQSSSQLDRRGQSGKQLQLLIIVLPDSSGSYGRIKRLCETELGIVSQCCQPRQLTKQHNKQYLENVSLKINVKAGGRNTVLSSFLNNRIPFVNDMPTIIFGADVTHPPPGEDSCPSIAAVVASMDWPHITKYRGLVSAQHHREEIIQDLYKCSENPQRGIVHSGMVRDLLIAFRRSTGHKPYRIIFYRDGVSEGQFSQVLLYEMDAIRKACLSLEENYLPKVTFVVVQKRHHTRLFPAVHGDRNSTDRSGNILPGTVVDRQICHPTEFDFFLCSHAGIQGTSRPTHYHVLFDENNFTADALQTLTNNLCYTYARCTRSVSIVPPAYYAHLAAFRARYYIEGEISDSGSTSGGGGQPPSGGGGQQTRERHAVVRPLPVIKDNVKDVMFYC